MVKRTDTPKTPVIVQSSGLGGVNQPDVRGVTQPQRDDLVSAKRQPIAGSKPKTKMRAVRDDDRLEDEGLVNQSNDVDGRQFAQAGTSGATSSPASVGEELLRQASTVPSKSEQASDSGMSWTWPAALGVGALALAGGGGGGGGGGAPPAPIEDEKTYALTITPMAGQFTNAGVSLVVYKNGEVWLTPSSTKWFNSAYMLSVLQTSLKAGDVLMFELKDANGTGRNFKDETTNATVDLGDNNVLHAWTVVPDLSTKTNLEFTVTPLTELAHRNMGSPDRLTVRPSAISAANAAVAQAFGMQMADGSYIDLVQTTPVATNGKSFSQAQPGQQIYGRALALVSSLLSQLRSSDDASIAFDTAPQVLSDALGLLTNVDWTPGNVLPKAALDKLYAAGVAYNVASSTASSYKLPGVTLNESLGLDKAVSLYDYDNGGLQFKLIAPSGKKAGDTVTLRFQTFNVDGLDKSRSFDYVYTLTGNGTGITAENVSLPRLQVDPTNSTNLIPVQDHQGHTLTGLLDTGAGVPTTGLFKYRVSLADAPELSAVQQDFLLNLSPIKIHSASTPGAAMLKADDTVAIEVVLSNLITCDVSPTLRINFIDKNGTLQTRDLNLDRDAVPLMQKINTLFFNYKFTTADNANGPITIPANALTAPAGSVSDPAGAELVDPFGAVNTLVSNSGLVVDTVVPPQVSLTLANSVKDPLTQLEIINTSTPEFRVEFVSNTSTTQSTLPADETRGVTVQLFAYRTLDSTDTSQLTAIATIKVGPTDQQVKISATDYTQQWKTTTSGANGESYSFFAKVTDGVGNESLGVLESEYKQLWLDNVTPSKPSSLILDKSPTNPSDPNENDNQIQNSSPTFTVVGDAGNKINLYTTTGTRKLVGHAVVGSDGQATVALDAPLPSNSYELVATQVDVAGNESADSAPENITIKATSSIDTVKLSIVSKSGYYKLGDEIRIQAEFLDGALAETIYRDRANPNGPDPEVNFKLNNGTTVTAGFVRASYTTSGTTTLQFSYIVQNKGVAAEGNIKFDKANVNLYLRGAFVDVVGNFIDAVPLSLDIPSLSTPLAIDTIIPSTPLLSLAKANDTRISVQEALNGAVAVVAEVGSTVDLTFTPADRTKKVTKTVTFSQASGTTRQLVKLTAADLSSLGNGDVTVTALARDDAANVSLVPGSLTSTLTFDLTTPAIIAASVDGADADATSGRLNGKDIKPINYKVTFDDALVAEPDVRNFATVNDMGVVNSVTKDSPTSNTYTVNVTPKKEQVGDLILTLVAKPSGGTLLADRAGNELSDEVLNGTNDSVHARQSVDTKAPVATLGTSVVAGQPANGIFDFTIAFDEPTKLLDFTNGQNIDNLSVTNGSILTVSPSGTTQSSGYYTLYTVTVKPADDFQGDMVLSVNQGTLASFVDRFNNVASFVDPLDETVSKPLLLTQAVDRLAPTVPTLANLAGQSATVGRTEAEQSGVLTVLGSEAGSSVVITFANATNQRTLVKQIDLVSTDVPVTVKLTSAEQDALGDGSISAQAQAKDIAGNLSAPVTLASPFLLDATAPTVSSLTDNIAASTSGSANITFTVSFSEALSAPPSSTDFVLTDPSLGTIRSVTYDSSTHKSTIVVTPTTQQKQGMIKLQFLNTVSLYDIAGNALVDPTAIFAASGQNIDTVLPVVNTVTDNVSAVANANAAIIFSVVFSKALDTTLTAAQLIASFSTNANNDNVAMGRVTQVTFDPNRADTLNISVQPTAGIADGQIWLNINSQSVLRDQQGNLVAVNSLQSFDVQPISTVLPSAPTSVELTTGSDTGKIGDNITSNKRPTIKVAGLTLGDTVTLYEDKDGIDGYRAGSVDTLIYSGVVTGSQMNIAAPVDLTEGAHTTIRAFQTNRQGNNSSATTMPSLTIQSVAPGALADLIFDLVQDTTSIGTTRIFARDYVTTRATPKFNFTNAVLGNTVVLFLDKNKDGVYSVDIDEELAQADITSSGAGSISVDPLHGLAAGAYGAGNAARGNIYAYQVNKAGLAGAVTALKLNGVPVDTSTGTTANFTYLTISPVATSAITISTTELTQTTAKTSLSFNLLTGGQLGGTITIVADQYDAADATVAPTQVVLGTTASPNVSGALSVDVSTLAMSKAYTYKNFRAYQTYGGVQGSVVGVLAANTSTATTAEITLEHVAPTVSIAPVSTSLITKGQAPVELTFNFSEAVTNFDASDIGGRVNGDDLTNPVANVDKTVWTALYTPASESTQTVALYVEAGGVSDLLGNTNTSASNTVSLLINTTTQHAPDNYLPVPVTSGRAGVSQLISGLSVMDIDGNLANVVLSVAHGTLSVSTTSASGVSVTGGGTSTLTLTRNAATQSALNAVLATLNYTPNGMATDTLTVISTDAGLLGATDAPLSQTSTLSISGIVALPTPPTNTFPTIDYTATAIVVNKKFGFNGANAINANDVNGDISSIELRVGKGVLHVSQTASGAVITGDQSATLTLTGTQSDVLQALATLEYTLNATAATTDTLTITTTDAANHVSQNSMNLSISAAPIAPVNTLPLSSFGVLAGATNIQLPQFSIGDADNNIASVELSVAHGALQVDTANTSVVSTQSTAPGTRLVLTSTSLQDLHRVLGTIKYTPDSTYYGTDTLTMSAYDSTTLGLGGPLSDTDTWSFTVGRAPVNAVTLPNDMVGGVSYRLGGLSVSDLDQDLRTVSLNVNGGQLTATATSANVTAVSRDAGATLTLSLSNGGSEADLNTVLQSVSYQAPKAGLTTGVFNITSTDKSGIFSQNNFSFDVDKASDTPHTGNVAISANASYFTGTVLTANTAGIADTDGMSTPTWRYQWHRVRYDTTLNQDVLDNISGATASTYSLTSTDDDRRIGLTATYTDDLGYTASVESSPITTKFSYPSSIALGSAVIRFYDNPVDSATPRVSQTTLNSARFVALDTTNAAGYYVLDITGDGISSNDMSTYPLLSSANSVFTTSSGVKLQLLSILNWQSLSTSAITSLFGNVSKPDFWTRDSATLSSVLPSHYIYSPMESSTPISAQIDDSSANNLLQPYHYTLYQVI